MTLKEKFLDFKKKAKSYAQAVRDRKSQCTGTYPKGVTAIDAVSLIAEVRLAEQLGFKTELRLINSQLHVFCVQKLPDAPYEVLYS